MLLLRNLPWYQTCSKNNTDIIHSQCYYSEKSHKYIILKHDVTFMMTIKKLPHHWAQWYYMKSGLALFTRLGPGLGPGLGLRHTFSPRLWPRLGLWPGFGLWPGLRLWFGLGTISCTTGSGSGLRLGSASTSGPG